MGVHRSRLALLAALLLVSSAMAPARAEEARIRNLYIAGNPYPGDQFAQMVADHAALMVRPVLEEMGLGVVWSPEDGSTTVVGSPASPAVLRPGDRVVRLKDRTVTLPIAPYLDGGRLYAPLDFFRALGIRAEWVSATREIELTPPPYSQVGEFGPPGAGPATFSSLGKDASGRLYLVVADGPRAGIWRSADHGASWEELSEGIGPVAAAKFITGKNGEVYLIPRAAHGMWRLDEEARRWVPVDARLEENLVVDAAVAEDGALWFVAQTPLSPGAYPAGVYRLDPPAEAKLDGSVRDLWLAGDGRLWAAGTELGLQRQVGESWERLDLGLPDPRAYQVIASPTDPNWMWALTGGTVMASQDGGQTWQDTAPWGIDPERWHEMKLLPGNGSEIFLLTGAGGVLYSPTGGGQWFRLTGYWPDARVLDGVMDGDRLFLATTSGGVIIPQRIPQPGARKLSRFAPRTPRWGANLAEGHQGAGGLWLDPQQPDIAYAALTFGGKTSYYQTVDGGAHWSPLPLPFAEALSPIGLFLHPTRSGYYGLNAANGLWVTQDNGATWSHMAREFSLPQPLANPTLLASGRIIGSFENRAGSRLVYTDDLKSLQDARNAPTWHITTILTNPAVPDMLYACDWHTERPCHLSVDGGETWQPLVSQPPPEAGRPIRLSWSPGAPDELFAGRFVSRDHGRTWQELPFFQPGDSVLQISVHPANPQVRAAVVDSDRGHLAMVSRDGGQTWTALGRPPGSLWVHAVQFDGKDRLWIGTDAGIWQLTPPAW